MSISILVEPGANGFRAAAGSPLDLSAEGDSVAVLRGKIAKRLSGGAMLIEQSVSNPVSPVPVLPLAENPLFDNWLVAIEEYRKARDAEERAAETN